MKDSEKNRMIDNTFCDVWRFFETVAYILKKLKKHPLFLLLDSKNSHELYKN